MKKIFAAIISLLLTLGMTTGNVTAAPNAFANPSFEVGLTGWTPGIPPGGFVGSVTEFPGFGPIHGERFALLKTDGPGSYTTLSQTFTVQAGDAISGWAFFKSNDTTPNFDNAQVMILKDGNEPVWVFFGNVIVGTRPWTFWTYEFPTAGTYTLQARIANGGNNSNDSVMGLDLIVFRVNIDVKPGSYPNSINLNSKGVLSVALLTTPIFNAADVYIPSVEFAGAFPIRHHLEDVDNDGDLDYLFQFNTADLDIPEGQDFVQLKARTISGYLIGGRDSINLVPPEK